MAADKVDLPVPLGPITAWNSPLLSRGLHPLRFLSLQSQRASP